MQSAEDIVKLSIQKEFALLESGKTSFSGLRTSKLRKQEVFVKCEKGIWKISSGHEIQDNVRLNTLSWMLGNCGLDVSLLNFEAIINSDDDVPVYEDDTPRLAFSKRAGDGNIMIPDPHLPRLCELVKRIPSMDVPADQKMVKAAFFGSDTGVYKTADKNQRFQFCMNNRFSEKGYFRITNFVEIDKDSLERYDWHSIASPFVDIPEQLKYKYLININGNTTCWDRLLWAMSSNSLCLFLEPQASQMSWYYHYLAEQPGMVYVTEGHWEESLTTIEQEGFFAALKADQHELVQPLLNISIHLQYLKRVIENYNFFYQLKS